MTLQIPRLNVPRRVCLLLTGTLLAALGSSAAALIFALWSLDDYKDMATANLEQARGIHELQLTIMRYNALVAWHAAEAHPDGSDELIHAEAEFETELVALGGAGLEADQKGMLEPIGDAFRSYVHRCAEALPSQESVDSDAPRLARAKAAVAYDGLEGLCKALAAANNRDIATAIAGRHASVRRVTLSLAVFLAILVIAGGLLARLFLGGVLGPLRRLTDDARAYLASNSTDPPSNDIEAVGQCMAELKANIAESWQRLIDAEKLATIGKLAAGVAHEIRSPLTSLKLRLFSIQKMMDEAPRSRSDLLIMSEEIDRLDSIVKNFLEFSRPPELCVQPCDATFLLSRTMELLRYKLEATGVALIREAPANLPALLVDPHQMRQVLLNLINNAIDAQPSGGMIRIEAQCQTEPDGEGRVLLRIRDSGTGIPASIAGRIFDPFFSTKSDGAGLGLWIAHRIVIQHGGTLRLEQSTGSGATFALSIPVVQEAFHEQDSGCGRRSRHPGRV